MANESRPSDPESPSGYKGFAQIMRDVDPETFGTASGVRIVHIAYCAEHGLHGCRTQCYECGGKVEQVPMVPWDDVKEAVAAWEQQPECDTQKLRPTHHVETYKPRPRPEGETRARIRAAVGAFRWK